MTTFTTEDKENAQYHPDGFTATAVQPVEGHITMGEVKYTPAKARNPSRPMSFSEIQECFGMSLGDEGMHAAIADMIELVRKVEKFHGIG